MKKSKTDRKHWLYSAHFVVSDEVTENEENIGEKVEDAVKKSKTDRKHWLYSAHFREINLR